MTGRSRFSSRESPTQPNPTPPTLFPCFQGGKRYLVEDSDATSQSFGNSSTKESSVGASVSYRGVTVSGSAAGGKTKSKEKSQGTQGSSSDVQAVGGNSLLTDDAAWVASLADSKFWRVIEFGHFQTVGVPLCCGALCCAAAP